MNGSTSKIDHRAGTITFKGPHGGAHTANIERADMRRDFGVACDCYHATRNVRGVWLDGVWRSIDNDFLWECHEVGYEFDVPTTATVQTTRDPAGCRFVHVIEDGQPLGVAMQYEIGGPFQVFSCGTCLGKIPANSPDGFFYAMCALAYFG